MAGKTSSSLCLSFVTATSLLALGSAWAAEPEIAPTQLDAVTATATRSATSLDDIAGTVSVIDAETLERNNAQTIRDAVRYEPGISVSSQPTRTGAGNYTIRGISDNRVKLLIDGQNVPDFPGSNAGAGTYTRDFVDLDAIKQIDIIRGPASALYGSDAIGGIVAYVTKDPSDYLDMVGKDWFVSLKSAYSSADTSFSQTATGAMRADNVEVLGLYTRRDGHQVEPNSNAIVNPQDFASNNFLGKLVFNLPNNDRLKFTGEFLDKRVDTDLQTELSGTVLDSQGEDTTKRTRVSVDYEIGLPFFLADSASFKAYYTKLDRNEHTDQLRVSGPDNVMRVSDNEFLQEIYGGEAQFNLASDLFGLTHAFTYGASFDVTSTSRPRNRTQTNLTTLVTTNVIAGETYPNKNFPDTDTYNAGLFLQDEMLLGRFTVTPAVRVDYYHLEPNPDQAFLNSSGGAFTVESVTKVPVSPKLGVTYALTDTYKLFGQYAHGFRAPPYDNANFGFRNSVYGYEIIPNGNLKPETSDGFEAGLRGKFGNGSSFSVAGFYNKYQDFIDTVTLGVSGGLLQFQYQNLPNVTIKGIEAKGEWRFHPGWSVLGSVAYADGEDEATGNPIDSVDPLKLVAGLRYTSEYWGAELTTTHAWEHDQVSSPTYYKTPAYTVVDLTAYVEVMPSFTINAGVFNLLDETYTLARDVNGVAATSATLDRYVQPGRNLGVNATIRF